MPKVLLLNPPSVNGYLNRDLMSGLGVNIDTERNIVDGFITRVKSAGRRMPVMALGYLNSVLSKTAEVKVIDAGNTDMCAERVIEESAKFNPDFVFAASSISQLPVEIKILEDIKSRTGARVGFVGESADNFSKMIMKECNIDFVIKGEPELIAPKIVHNRVFSGLQNVIYKNNGKVVETGGMNITENLDELPYPSWKQFPMKKYGYFPVLNKKPFITMQSSRGCPYGCIYCPYTSFMGARWRFRNVDNVMGEIQYLKEKYKIRSVLFRDPIFTLDKKRAAEICDKIVQNGLNIEWACETRPDCLTVELVDRMADAGCVGINVGIESNNPKILANVKRLAIPEEHIRRIVSRCYKKGINVTGFFILGLPGETSETIKRTIRFSMSLGLSYAEYKVATPYPGTPLYEMAIKKGWYNKINTLSEFPAFTSYNAYIKLEDLSTTEIEKLCAEAFRTFYLRPKVMFREIMNGTVTNPFILREAISYLGYKFKQKLAY